MIPGLDFLFWEQAKLPTHQGLRRTFLALALKVLCPENSLSPGQNRATGHPRTGWDMVCLSRSHWKHRAEG